MIYESPPRGGEKLKEHDSEVKRSCLAFPYTWRGKTKFPKIRNVVLFTAMRREFSELYKSLT